MSARNLWWRGPSQGLTGNVDLDNRFSPTMIALLDAAEERFAITGANTPGWDDPRADPESVFGSRDPYEDEYSRLSNPGKYAILSTRLQAWREVLVERGLAIAADRSGVITWPLDGNQPDKIVILRPVLADAPQIGFAEWHSDDGWCGIQIGVGDQLGQALDLPQCGCDACDNGSQALLDDLDEMMFSLIDGSFYLRISSHSQELRTSFFSSRSESALDSHRKVEVTGKSWLPGHQSRPVVPSHG